MCLPLEMPTPIPMMMTSQDATNAGLANFMKSSFVVRMMCSMGIDFMMFMEIITSNTRRVTTSAVNKLAATPMVSATPKPLMVPVPMYQRMMDEMSVVTCESKMVPKARL